MGESKSLQTKTVVIAVGGATCSGKTLLAKNIAKALPNSFIIHQDDFAPLEETLPFKGEHRDWDAPATAIDWPFFRRAVIHGKKTAEPLPELRSHDHLNKQVEVEVSPEIYDRWRERFRQLMKEEEGAGLEWKFVIVDGFLLYYDKECVPEYDVRLFLRVPYQVLKTRRETRAQYITQNALTASAGDVWSDPPNYFDEIVYPAYVEAHEGMFVGGDVEKGELKEEWVGRGKVVVETEVEGKGKGKEGEVEVDGKALEVFTPAEGQEGMEGMVDRALGLIFDAVQTME